MNGSTDVRVTSDATLERTRRFVEQETPSGDEGRCAALAELLSADLEAVGAGVEQIDAPGRGRHVSAAVPGSEVGLAPVVLLGHLDTVHPVGTLEEQPFRVLEGRAEGPGIFDMKANLAVMVEVLARFADAERAPRRPVRVLVTCDEEVGSPSSRGLIEDTARDAAAVLVPEPSLPGGVAKTARKGVAVWELRVLGRPAHAGIEPERGVSAIEELAHQITAVLALADPARGTTVNVGTIRGGSAINVVAAEAVAEVEARFASSSEGERVAAGMRGLEPVIAGARLEVDQNRKRPPLERTEGVVQLYETARELAAERGFSLEEGSTGGASDGCLTAALGVPTLDGLGVQGGGAHATDEHIIVDDLPRRVALLSALLETL